MTADAREAQSKNGPWVDPRDPYINFVVPNVFALAGSSGILDFSLKYQKPTRLLDSSKFTCGMF